MHFAFQRERKAFTLVELLVVIAVIGLLFSVVFAQLSSARAKARDAEREQDIKTLQSALALYTNTRGTYPATDLSGVCLDGSDAVSAAIVAEGVISTVPRDPLHNCATTAHYHYTAPDGSTYTITYYLETDTIPGKSSGAQQASP